MYHFTIGFFIAIILSAVVNVVNAAETRPYMYRVQQTAQLQSLLNRGSVPVTYETVATTPAGQQVTRYTTRNTVMNATRLGSIARSAVGGPAVLAATAAYLAYDYFYNENLDEWQVNPQLSDVAIPGSVCFPRTGQQTLYDVSMATCWDAFIAAETGNIVSNWLYRQYTVQAEYTGYCIGSPANNACRNSNYYRVPHQFIPDLGSEPFYGLPRNATDEDLGDAVKNAPPQAVSDILNDPISSGTWPDRWPEMVPTTEEIEGQLGHDIEGAPAPVNPDQTITDGSTARPSADASSGSESSELPAFCDWVPDWLCDVMDLPEHPEVPFTEIAEPDAFDSGIGAGQCPADVMVATQFGSIPISWEYPCELATTFRPVVLFFAWIAALYIVVRVK